MSQDWHADVLEFHNKFCPEQIGAKPEVPSGSVIDLRVSLMREELDETFDAMYDDDLEGIADGLTDLIYVAIGTAIAYGIDLRPVFDEVHAANIRKAGGKRVDGKTLKGPDWTPPDIKAVLAKQGA